MAHEWSYTKSSILNTHGSSTLGCLVSHWSVPVGVNYGEWNESIVVNDGKT